MDETWIYPYTPEFNRQSADSLMPDESSPKHPKTQQSVGHVLATTFWDIELFTSPPSNMVKTNTQDYCVVMNLKIWRNCAMNLSPTQHICRNWPPATVPFFSTQKVARWKIIPRKWGAQDRNKLLFRNKRTTDALLYTEIISKNKAIFFIQKTVPSFLGDILFSPWRSLKNGLRKRKNLCK